MSAVNDAAKAPGKAISFVKNNLLAAAVLVVAVAVAVIWMETRKPGSVRDKVAKLPLVGKKATGQG